MALSKPVVEVHDEELTCAICQDLFTDPTVLTCGHTFCRECLKEFYAKRPDLVTQVLDCPTCRKSNKLGEYGVQGLPRNYILNRIMEARQSEKGVPCMICDGDPCRDAIQSCLKCELSFCAECLDRRHPNRGPYKEHTMVKARYNLKPTKSPKCIDHGGNLGLFCNQCSEPVCLICVKTGDHKNHDILPLQAAFEAQKSNMTVKSTSLRKTADDIEGALSGLQKEITRNEKDAAGRSAALELAHIRSIQDLDERKSNALDKITREKITLENKTLECIASMEKCHSTAARCLQLTTEAIKETDPISFLVSVPSLNDRLDEEITNATKSFRENSPNKEGGDSGSSLRVDILVPVDVVWATRRFFYTNGAVIECPELTLDAATAHETVRVQGGNKQLVNIKQSNDQLFSGASVTQSFTQGMVYFETLVKYTEKTKLTGKNLVMSAGVFHSRHTDYCVGDNKYSWGIRIAHYEGNLCFYDSHRYEYSPVFPESDSYPPSGEVRVGYLLDCDRKRLTILDCTHDRLLYTHNNLDLTEPLTPAESAHNHRKVDVTITLVTGEDITRLPESIEQVI